MRFDTFDKPPIELIASGYTNLSKSGHNKLKGLCPLHSEATASFQVNTQLQRYICFGCGAKGDVIDLVMRAEGLSFIQAVEALKKR